MADENRGTASPASAVSEFEHHAGARRRGLLAELWAFLRDNKKWWLLPIVITMLGLGVLVVLGGGATPFLYALF